MEEKRSHTPHRHRTHTHARTHARRLFRHGAHDLLSAAQAHAALKEAARDNFSAALQAMADAELPSRTLFVLTANARLKVYPPTLA